MEAVGNPKIWVPYMDTKKDCSQGLCTEYCPQWCLHVAASPPQPSAENGTKFHPLLITVLGVLFSGLLLFTYFAVISKFCRKKSSDRRHTNNHDEEMQAGGASSVYSMSVVGGLDESFIKSIAVCVYKKGNGLVEGPDCAVCLGEFRENERLRMLPKCGHYFHLNCIDVWLESHSTCPLCRASLITRTDNASQLPQPPPPSLEIHTVNV